MVGKSRKLHQLECRWELFFPWKFASLLLFFSLSFCMYSLIMHFIFWMVASLELVFHCLLYRIQVLLCLCSLANVYDLHSLDGG